MRTILLWMARNPWLKERVPRWPFVRRAVRSFLPGEDLEAAITAAQATRSAGITAAFTRLGENVTDLVEAQAVADHYRTVLDEIAARGLDAEVSIKLTQLGYDLDVDAAFEHFDAIARRAGEIGTWAWIDMEGSAYVEGTIAFYERARAAHPNVGLCLQAYLHRTPADVQRLLPIEPAIRLVKGAYDEPATIAYRARHEVDAAFLAIAATFAPAVRAGTARFMAGTHDIDLIEQIARFGRAIGLEPGQIEVEMLYGVRADQQRRLAARGFDVRCLIAYGEHWYPWYMRRLAERPANVIFAVRQVLPW
ncbi:MAG: proline dehydrogenase family protein [Chloroflexota bacterium]|nr:proline dehydrogenase family protein [Chloroflexota bacterium]